MKDSNQWSTVMTATLAAELEGRVPGDLVADLVRAVLDESRGSAHDRGVGPTMHEARRRMERFARVHSTVCQEQPGNQSKPVASPTALTAVDSPDMAGRRS